MGRLFTILWTDSLLGRYSVSGLTALSIIYPIQLLMIVLAVGTGVGVKAGREKRKEADEFAGAAIATVAGQMVAAAVGAKRIPSRTQKSSVSCAHRKGLSLGRPEYPDAVRLYLLYFRAEPHSVGILRSGGHCAGALL